MRVMILGLALGFAVCGACQSASSPPQGKGPDVEAYAPGQNIADALKAAAGADGAFIAAAMLDTKKFQADDLSKLLVYPGDQIVVVSLTGAQIRQAFERSLSLHPQRNYGFLQISGFEVVFSADAPVNQRVKSVLASGAKLDETRNYQVAMPVGLARGGYG